MKYKHFALFLMGLLLIGGCNNVENNPSKDLLDSLSSSEFETSEANNEFIGLSDIKNIGVNEENFYNEKLYSSENKSFDVIIDALDFNVNGNDNKDDTLAFISLINKVKEYENKSVKVLLPSGNLDFIEKINHLNRSYGIVLNNLKNVVFKGSNTNIYFHGEIGGFILENCENVYFEDINIDYAIPPFVVGKIKENDGKTFKVKVNDGYTVNENTKVAAFLEYNKTSFTPRSKGNDIYGNVKNVKYLNNNELEITFNSTYNVAPYDTLVVIRQYLYEHDCIFINNSKNIYYETVNVYSCPGMGVRAHSSENLYFNRFNVKLKPNTDRLMTSTADALHFIDCVNDLIVSNSLFENCGDDALNSHGAYLQIKAITDDYSIEAINPRGYNFIPSIGNILEINKRNDLSLVQQLTVKEVARLKNGGFKITFNEKLSSDIAINYVVGNASRCTKLHFYNNIVRNKRCRGVLVQSRNTIIENNTFANLSDGGILVTADANNWYESITSQDLIIRNNKFLKNNYAVGNTYGDIAISSYGENYNLASCGTLKNFLIENNFFANGANGAVFANSVSDLTIKNNCVYNMGLQPKAKSANVGFSISYCDDVKVSNNRIYKNSSADFKSLTAGGGMNANNLLVSNNTGIEVSNIFNESETKTFSIIKTNSNDLMDGEGLSNWKSIESNIALYGFSDVDLNELELDDTTFKINELKMAYNDEGIFIGFDVFDDELIYNYQSSWEGDGVEIFMSSEIESLDPLSVVKISNTDTLEIFMSNDTINGNKLVELRTSANIMEKQNQFKIVFEEKYDGKGYVGKVFIPFSAIKGIKDSLMNNKPFSFAINFIDLDSYGIRRQYASCPHIVEYNKYIPSKMSRIVQGD